MNARSKTVAVCLVALAAGCAGGDRSTDRESIAAAQTAAATPPTVSFAEADLNRDARIDRHEFNLWLRKSDTNAVSARAAAGGSAADDAFSAADTNANGVLTLDEWQAMIVNPSIPAPAAASRSPRPPSAPSGEPAAPPPATLGR
jgi:hypothetical protein